MKHFKKITLYLLKHNIISDELAPWLTYSLQHFSLSVFSFILLLFFGWYIQGLDKTIAFLFSFLVLRRYIGGWHAASPVKCLIFSAFMEWVFLFVFYPLITFSPMYISCILGIMSIISVFTLAPLLPRKLHETAEQRAAMKKLSRCTIILEFVIMILFFILRLPFYAICVSLGISCAAFSLWIEKTIRKLHKGGIL